VTQKEKILDKIKKLLKLANSDNEHEAAAAAARATKLMLEYEIEEAMLADDDSGLKEAVEEQALDETGNRVPWKLTLVSGLTRAFDCDCLYSWNIQWVKGKKKRVTVYKIIGQPSKLATVRYMYQYLVGEINRLADKAYGEEARERQASGIEAPPARGWKNGFRYGAATMIHQRLAEQRSETRREAQDAGKTQALVRINESALAVQSFKQQKYPRLGSAPAAVVSSRSGFSAGRAAGKSVSLGGGGPRLGAGAKRLKN